MGGETFESATDIVFVDLVNAALAFGDGGDCRNADDADAGKAAFATSAPAGLLQSPSSSSSVSDPPPPPLPLPSTAEVSIIF